MPVPQPMPMPGRIARTLIALTPPLARSILPLPAGSSSPDAAAVGEIEWRIESLPAGSYEMVIQYACPALTRPLPVRVEFAGQKIEVALDVAKTTKDATTYRLLRLGQITLATEARGETLRLSADTRESTALLVRQFVIARAKR